jgi:general secretion pathway protein G
MQQNSARNLGWSERGLTLIEIMVVLIIIGLVMTMLAGKIMGGGDKAKAELTKIKIKQIGQSIEQFRLQYNAYPSSLEDLTKCTDKTGPGCTPICNEEELKDAWGTPLIYTAENGGRSYRVKSLGSDKQEGGEGVNFDFFGTGP